MNCTPFSFEGKESVIYEDFDTDDLGQWMVIDNNDNYVNAESLGWSIEGDYI